MKNDGFIKEIYCASLIESGKVVETYQFNTCDAVKAYLLKLLIKLGDKEFYTDVVDDIMINGEYVSKRYSKKKNCYINSKIILKMITFV